MYFACLVQLLSFYHIKIAKLTITFSTDFRYFYVNDILLHLILCFESRSRYSKCIFIENFAFGQLWPFTTLTGMKLILNHQKLLIFK